MAKPSGTKLDQLETKAKNSRLLVPLFAVAAVLVGIASFTNAIRDISDTVSRWTGEEPWVSITCNPEQVPLTTTGPIWGVLLHPKWGNKIQSGASSTPSLWPRDVKAGVGYQCKVQNGNREPLLGLTVPLQVDFLDKAATVPGRSIDVPIPDSIGAGETLTFHIADDTNWNPEVVLPSLVRGRLGKNNETQTISVRQTTTTGDRMRLKGFGPPL